MGLESDRCDLALPTRLYLSQPFVITVFASLFVYEQYKAVCDVMLGVWCPFVAVFTTYKLPLSFRLIVCCWHGSHSYCGVVQ
jgi:hypothetical protein